MVGCLVGSNGGCSLLLLFVGGCVCCFLMNLLLVWIFRFGRFCGR